MAPERSPQVTTPATAKTTPDGHDRYDAAGRSSSQIREDIRHTRDDMSSTLNALEQRISPRHLWHETVDMLKDETQRSRFFNTIRTNPIPSFLIAAGATWLGADIARGPHEPKVHEGPGRTGAAREKLSHVRDSASGAWHSLTGKARHARDVAAQKRQGAAEGADAAREQAHEAAAAFSQHAHGLSDRAHAFSQRARHQSADAFHEHPLTLGGLSAAAGLLLGLMLPETRKEDEVMGQASADTRHRASEMASEQGQDLKQKASNVAQTTMQAAESELDKTTDQYIEEDDESQLPPT